jgi:adenosylmethionine-8-amino-7-oxononanoate aminotransferase
MVPDILCLSKALTGGTLPLAATVARRHVFEAFLSDDPGAALMHGPTYMANPLACAAANASLDLFEREPRLAQVAAIEAQLRAELEPCREHRRRGRRARQGRHRRRGARPAPSTSTPCAGAFPSSASGCVPLAAWCT